VETSLALHVSKVSKRYGPTVALAEASLAVEKGACHALIGENGAGKSTLVKILSGTVSPDEGTISVAGRPTRLRSSREALAAGLATAFQELSLVPALTVAQNMMLGREPRRRGLVSNDGLADAARRLFAEWELEGVDPDVPVSELSLAVRQQLELVRVLSREAEVLLLDEPTAALGAVQVEWLFRQIARIRERGGTIVFISHRMGEVREICDRVTVLRSGRDVATFETGSATDDEVVEMMLGHSIEQVVADSGPAPEVGGPALTVTNLSCEPALRDASFTLHSGEVLGVAALQGHGQFELFMALFGARRTAGGTIELDGRPVRLKSPQHAIRAGLGISLVPEDRKAEGVMLEMSGLSNVTLPSIGRFSRFGFLSTRAERAAALEVMRSLNVRLTALDDDVSALSGGNQQKLAIGKWMLADNRVLLLYDPTRGVDIGTKTEIFSMMRDMAREGRSILFYSTEIEELLGVSNRVIVLYRGRVVAELSGAGCTQSAVLTAMLGSSRPPAPPREPGHPVDATVEGAA
jgi:ribose transport system ATP-binding protein